MRTTEVDAQNVHSFSWAFCTGRIVKGMDGYMLLLNGIIMTMDTETVQNGFVRVLDGKITDVGDMARAPAPEAGEKVIALAGRLLTPGFVDAHCHLGLCEDGLGLEGDDLNEDADPVTPHIRAIDGINPLDRCFREAVAGGVTCVVVAPGSANPVAGQIAAFKTSGRWIDEMAVREPVAIKFALGENPKMSYSNKALTPVTRMATAALIREQLFKARRYLDDIEKAEDDPELDKPDYDARCEALIPLLKGEIRAHFHAHKAYDILSAVRIAKEFGLSYTIIHATEGYLIADILADLRADVICGPLICTRTKPELAHHSAENCAKLLAAGVNVAVSTDFPEIPINLLAHSAAFAAANGMPRDAAFQAITIHAAKAAGLQDRVGSVTPGKDADLNVFSRDPFEVGAKPDMVLINGKCVCGAF